MVRRPIFRDSADARCFEIQPTPDVESSSKKEWTSEGLELPWSRCCRRIELPGSRCCGRLRVFGKPTRWRKEWERSRRCGWEIEVGADSAAARLVPGADFNCSQRDFSAIFQENFRAENVKNGPLDPRRPPETVALERRRLYVWGNLVESRIHKR